MALVVVGVVAVVVVVVQVRLDECEKRTASRRSCCSSFWAVVPRTVVAVVVLFRSIWVGHELTENGCKVGLTFLAAVAVWAAAFSSASSCRVVVVSCGGGGGGGCFGAWSFVDRGARP